MHLLLDHTFLDPIWRLVPSSFPSYPAWLVETRSSQEKKVSYSFFSQGNTPFLLHTGLDWWSGIEALWGQWALFHGFLQQDLPIHQGVMVFDTTKNKVAWQDELLSFASVEGDTLWAILSTGNATKIALHLHTGKEQADVPDFQAMPQPEIHTVFQEDPYFAEISDFVFQHTGHRPIRMLEYRETSQHILISYFHPRGKLLDNFLLATMHGGTKVLHESLHLGQKGIGKGTFHEAENFLCFVKDQRRLLVYALT